MYNYVAKLCNDVDNYVLCICLFCMPIENHRRKSITSRFYSKTSVYFVKAIMERLVWQAVSSAPGSLVQKVGVGGHAHPAPKLGARCPPPAPLAPASLEDTLLFGNFRP